MGNTITTSQPAGSIRFGGITGRSFSPTRGCTPGSYRPLAKWGILKIPHGSTGLPISSTGTSLPLTISEVSQPDGEKW